MSIYDYNIALDTERLTPPNKREETTLSFLGVFGDKLQYLHDLFFNDYADGSSADDWSSVTTYLYLQRVRYKDNYIYELNVPSLVSATPPNQDSQWVRVLNNWVGVRERSKYTSHKIVFEYALNKWFKTTFSQPTGWDGSGNPTPRSDIYIQNNDSINHSFVFGANEAESSAVFVNDLEQQEFINIDINFNKNMFTINIPSAVYDALLSSDPPGITTPKDNIVRAFADKYVLGGVNYNIAIY